MKGAILCVWLLAATLSFVDVSETFDLDTYEVDQGDAARRDQPTQPDTQARRDIPWLYQVECALEFPVGHRRTGTLRDHVG